MTFIKKSGATIAWACLMSRAFGGTIITSNLPPNTAIINVSGTQDGAGSFNGDQSLWYQPFNTTGTLLEYTVQAGTYSFRVIDPADAAQLFPALADAQRNQIYTAWTYNSPWIEDYLVFDGSAATNNSIPQIFDGAPDPTGFGDAASAYNDAVAKGYSEEIRPGPLGRNGTVFTNAYTFAARETLIFVVPDYELSDNNGGVSVVISPVNPAPTLTISEESGSASLEWATNFSGFKVSQTTNLPTGPWSDVGLTAVITNNHYLITVPVDPVTNHFFRLHN